MLPFKNRGLPKLVGNILSKSTSSEVSPVPQNKDSDRDNGECDFKHDNCLMS